MKRFLFQLFKVAIFSSVGITSVMFTFLLGIIIISLVVGGIGSASKDSTAVSVSEREYVAGNERTNQELLVISITGVIMGEAEPVDDWLTGISTGVTYGYQVKEELTKAADEPNIKGILLQINSPGGTIYGSNAILDGVTEYKQKSGKPVVAYVNGLAASGAYWSAIGADTIIADTGTTIGSIGVIFGPFKYYDSVVSEDGGLLSGGIVTEKGIQTTYITAGKSKDLGNPYRQLTSEEVTTLQNMVNQAYEQFVSKVSQHRQLEPQTIKTQIGALVYSEEQAQKLKLIDAVGSKQFAYAALAQKANLGSDYKVTRLKQEPTFWGSLLSAITPVDTRKAGTSICQLHSMILAYHGDVSSLCQ